MSTDGTCDVCGVAISGDGNEGPKNDALKALSIIPRKPNYALCRYCINVAIRAATSALDAWKARVR